MKHVKTKAGKLYISPCPSERLLNKIGRFDIIWNLASETEFNLNLENRFADKVLLAKITDYDIPTDYTPYFNQLKEVSLCLINGGKVLIHCLCGHGRTGMALACVKMVVDKIDAAPAIRFALKQCKGPEKEIQMLFVANNKDSIFQLI